MTTEKPGAEATWLQNSAW